MTFRPAPFPAGGVQAASAADAQALTAGPPARIAAVGAGRMGRGIALAFAWAGHPVDLIDFKPRAADVHAALADDARREMRSSLAMLAELGGLPADAIERLMERIRVVDEAGSGAALARADVVFEGVPETREAKADAFARICRHVRDDAILASTTSTILVTELVAMVTHPRRLLNAHWLNPAYVIPLVELSAHPDTAPEVVARLKAMLVAAGKMPVVCGASPGFIVPRLQALMMNEAARMVEEGVASAEDIDRATRYGLGLRYAAMGVVEFIDYGGNDILYHASRYMADTVSRERYAPPAIVERLMHEGRIGLKAGEGFYDYRGIDVDAYRKDVLARVLGMLRQAGLQHAPK